MPRPPVTGSRHPLPFDRLSSSDFERLCLWLIRREGYQGVEYLGEAGSDQGRDLVARKDGRLVVFQCKRRKVFNAALAREEIAKIRELPADEQPTNLVFVVTTPVRAAIRNEAQKAWGEKATCHFWAGAELDERVKRHEDVVREFFQLQHQYFTDGKRSKEDEDLKHDHSAKISVVPKVRTLRIWPPPGLPEQPYPVLYPYTHPDLIAGREAEVGKLRLQLRTPVPVLGLSASSGIGKSSLLLGGLVPALRFDGTPVAVARHPHEPGVAGRLVGDLLQGLEDRDMDWRSFVRYLLEVVRIAGEAPLLVLDQFEDVLRSAAARRRLGLLLAATSRRCPGTDEPLCRWLVSYRGEFHGELLVWLEDVLSEAREDGIGDDIGELPYDLSGSNRFQALTLAPLATPLSADDVLAEATRVFQTAIEKPLSLRNSKGEPHYIWRFAPGHAKRLAQAFAEARLRRPSAPLVPEFQVVLAHLLAQAAPHGLVTVPDNPSELVEEALMDHLRRALNTAFPAGARHVEIRRARALLALRHLATAGGEGVATEEVIRAIGEDGERTLEQLATPLTRLVVLQRFPDGLRYMLSHDSIADAVVRMVDEEGRHGRISVDAELLALRRYVAVKTALHQSQEAQGVQIPGRHFRTVATYADALLWDDEQRAWWVACREHRQAKRRRLTAFIGMAVALSLLMIWGIWNWAERRGAHQALLSQFAKDEPGDALIALTKLLADPAVNPDDLLRLLRQRPVAMDVLEHGLGEVPQKQRSTVVLRTVELALHWVAESPTDPVLIANLVWALDYAPGRDPLHTENSRTLRDRVLAPLREERPPPTIPDDDPDWIEIPTGTFLMGSPDGTGDSAERPQHEVTISSFRIQRHEVTNANYQRFDPEHVGGDDLPVANITWYEAYTYTAWLGGRLPTEAEWEYAARAGCPHAYCTQVGERATVDDVAWTLQNSGRMERLVGSIVMQLEPNPWKLYDLLGNHWEWTADWFAEYPAGAASDPWGPASGDRRVMRGGSSRDLATRARVENRVRYAPGYKVGHIGCRAVVQAAPQSGGS